jgi:hypothetical protein
MKNILIASIWFISASMAFADETSKEESNYLGLLHKLQYVETPKDLKEIILNCPVPTPYIGEDNTQILIKTKLFGFDAKGTFSFHKGILVSHGFEVLTPTYKDAHGVFLQAANILKSQVKGLHLSAELPFSVDEHDSSDGPRDEIDVAIDGINKDATFGLTLAMRQESIVVRWGAQKVSPSQKAQIEQDASVQPLPVPTPK